jgi:drug/metabolite transporter (DMT)-like permease
MVYVVGIVAALSLGLGWVVQQRVAAHAALSELLSLRLLVHLMRKRVWWLGIAAMAVGQGLGAVALQLGSVTLAEPLLSLNLVFAFIFAAVLSHERTRPLEVGGALLVCASLAVFLDIADPQPARHANPTLGIAVLAACVVFGVVAGIIYVARRLTLAAESMLIAAAAGVLYGLQDVATRASLQVWDHHGALSLVSSPWPYLVVVSAVVGILLSQSAFRAARLDYSLPPTAAAEPVVAIALAVSVLGDELSSAPVDLLLEACCLVAMIVGVVLIGRSATLGTSAIT